MKIYHIMINNETVYVGKTINPKQRTRQHKWLLVNNRHENKYLQEQYNLYGEFDLVVVKEEATDRDEQKEIQNSDTQQRNNRAEPSLEELRELHRKVFSKKKVLDKPNRVAYN